MGKLSTHASNSASVMLSRSPSSSTFSMRRPSALRVRLQLEVARFTWNDFEHPRIGVRDHVGHASSKMSCPVNLLKSWKLQCNGDSDQALDSDCGCAGSIDGWTGSRGSVFSYSLGFAQSSAIRAGSYLDRHGEPDRGDGEGYFLSGRFRSRHRAGGARNSDTHHRFAGGRVGRVDGLLR